MAEQSQLNNLTINIIILCFTFQSLSSAAESHLTVDFYSKSCLKFLDIIRETITNKQISTPTTAAARGVKRANTAAALRLFFHDCFPNGCDASVLVSSTTFNTAERDSSINLFLPGDGFDVVIRAKTALELACPNTVSCSDIIAVAVRDLLVTVAVALKKACSNYKNDPTISVFNDVMTPNKFDNMYLQTNSII
ncbi:hypothetical protein ARALYDRAFT_901054 [Arabidopsis lyrata subsp. lyrata]|uniref:peroxidase n=1 Tax=Arabidopsis lyrata subsp. lyrata TaxID=81972 RepID=D7LIW7_ARALL|nr:hypothetical protein ARALYDRAFT_901054 [Arabidopsis lyrata subsp. lyrata]